jgi:hypothetical protein
VTEKSSGYVVSKGGTFGVVQRKYTTDNKVKMVIIRWGRLGWVTPVKEESCKFLSSPYELEARKEAEKWLKTLEAAP